MLTKLDHKRNYYDLEIKGNFKDGKDSMYFISKEESWHVTFVKVGNQIEEWVRKVFVLEGMDDVFLSEVEFKYTSEFSSVRSYRAFLKKQNEFEDYKKVIVELLFNREKYSESNRGFAFDGDTPF